MVKDGVKVRIKANTSKHHFEIGEEVTLVMVTSDDIYGTNEKECCWITEDDFEEIIKN
jgi:hypothetical protein